MRATATRLLLALPLLLAGVAWAGGPEDLARSLATLRSEVEALNQELDLDKAELRSRLRGLDEQTLELSGKVRQEELKLSQLQEGLEQQRKAREADALTQAALAPSVGRSILLVRGTVEAGLPFRQAERLAELDKLSRQLQSGEATPQEVASRLWSFTEDELRLSQENGLARQVIVLQGQEQLVELAHLGLAALFFRTEDGRVGRAVRRDGAWTWEELPNDSARQQVQDLFTALSRQVRSGPFTLPLEISR